jgi:hypothetical protein
MLSTTQRCGKFWTLDQAGKWYKGKAADGAGEENKLYYKAAPGQDSNTLEIEFKNRAFGFAADARDYIRVEGMTFRGVSIDTDGSTDFNVYAGNNFYGFNRAGYGRFYLNGTNNVIRDSEIYNTFNYSITVGGTRNSTVNNYIHHVGLESATARVLPSSGALQLLVSNNTVDTFARSFVDGLPSQAEFVIAIPKT